MDVGLDFLPNCCIFSILNLSKTSCSPPCDPRLMDKTIWQDIIHYQRVKLKSNVRYISDCLFKKLLTTHKVKDCPKSAILVLHDIDLGQINTLQERI